MSFSRSNHLVYLMLFHSHETDAPFTHCCDCGCELLNAEMYIINQSFVKDECVFEMAICIECRQQIQEQLSEKSRVAMFDFMHDHVDMEQRMQMLKNNTPTEDYIAKCLTCHQPKDLTKGYTLGAMFTGETLLKGPFPMMICNTCEEALAESLSEETRKVWRDFMETHFPGPPSEVKIPSKNKPLFI